MRSNPPFLLLKVIMIEKKISDLIEQPLNSLGYELVRTKLISSDIIQIMIDNDAGINIKDCTKATRLINNILQVAEINDYGLEVSSPGMDRPLIKPEHFLKHIGQDIKLNSNELIDGQKRFTGKLINFNKDNNDIELSSECKVVVINLNQMQSANLYYQPVNNHKKTKRN